MFLVIVPDARNREAVGFEGPLDPRPSNHHYLTVQHLAAHYWFEFWIAHDCTPIRLAMNSSDSTSQDK